MRHIDIEAWPRREHFEAFRTFDFPHFNMCANVDLTTFYPFVKQHGISLNVATIYILTHAANAVHEFRYRLRGEEVIEHEIVHPGSTIMGKNDVFSFCTMEYRENFPDFVAENAEKDRERSGTSETARRRW